MKFYEGEVVSTDGIVFLTGDGGREKRVIEALAEKYNHKKTIFRPTFIPHRTGLTGVVEQLATLTNLKISVKSYLIVIDKEHVNNFSQVERKLGTYGFEILEKKLEEGAWIVKCRKGVKEIMLYLAVMGEEKCIEENLAKLIRLRFGEEVGPTKRELDKWLKSRGMNERSIIEGAGEDVLRKSLPNLVTLLEEINITL
ncbi:MAG TPA: hypothetical protein EYH44_01150 [Thermoprotei archaeon]|nr:hypothetical protein [Thermoprotei archaeon]